MEEKAPDTVLPTTQTIFRNDVKMRRHSVFGGWHVTKTGYARCHAVPYKLQYLHRAIVHYMAANPAPELAQNKLPDVFDVHHQDGDKLHNCPCNFVILDKALHGGTGNRIGRCPYTGKYLIPDEYRRQFGDQRDEVPF